MTKQEFFELADRYSVNECSPEEARSFEHFCNELHEDKILDTWQTDELEKSRIKILSNINDRLPENGRESTGFWSPLKIAASIAILIGVSLMVYFSGSQETISNEVATIEKTTGKGQKLTITLPDGSTVRLNSESSIAYTQSFSGSTREVQLKGEAFFDVVKNPDKPFQVVTPNLNTTVLGTSFNIDAYDDNASVTVATGKVKVSSKGGTQGSTVFLEQSDQAVFDQASNSLTVNTVDLYSELAWKDNRLLFKDASLEEACRELEKWFGVEIQIGNDNLKLCKFSSVYENESLEKILDELKFILNIDYTISQHREIKLSGNGCLN